MDILRLTSITAANAANANEYGRNVKLPSAENPQMLNEQNFHNATHISATDTGLSSKSDIFTIRLFRKRSIPANTAESMKYDGASNAADATTAPNAPFML